MKIFHRALSFGDSVFLSLTFIAWAWGDVDTIRDRDTFHSNDCNHSYLIVRLDFGALFLCMYFVIRLDEPNFQMNDDVINGIFNFINWNVSQVVR